MVRPTEEEFGGQVPARFAAEGALDGDGLKWELFPTRRHIAAAPLASDDEGFSARGGLEHGRMIGKM